MYIFLDESYNLKNRNKKQFISINGFSVLDEKALFKKWKEYRKPFIRNKGRIHAKEKFFDDLRLKALKLIKRNDVILLSVFQAVQEIPFDKNQSYFSKGKLDFDKVYLDLAVKLFNELNLQEYRKVVITVDNRKHKVGELGKELFRSHALNFLETKYDQTKFTFTFQPSATNVLLELADFVSNILYRAYLTNNEQFFEDLKFKIIQLKNPLK